MGSSLPLLSQSTIKRKELPIFHENIGLPMLTTSNSNDTPAMVEAERIKRFVFDKDTYARSVTPHNEEGGRPNGKAHS